MTARSPRPESPRPVQSSASGSSNAGCLGMIARIYWMGAGFLVPFFLAVGILRGRGFDLTASDLGYWAGILSLAIVRLVDVRFLNGDTSTGQPATMADGWKFAGLVLVAGLAAWGLAHGVAAARA